MVGRLSANTLAFCSPGAFALPEQAWPFGYLGLMEEVASPPLTATPLHLNLLGSALCCLGSVVQNGPRYSVLAVGFRDRLQAAKSCGIQRYCLAHKHTVPVGLAAADCPKRPPSWERSLRAILPFWITLGRPPVHFHISLFKECPSQCLPR